MKVPRLTVRRRRISPREEARQVSRCRRGEKVDFRETPTLDDLMEDILSQAPIRKRPEARRRVREKILLRRDEHWQNADCLSVS